MFLKAEWRKPKCAGAANDFLELSESVRLNNEKKQHSCQCLTPTDCVPNHSLVSFTKRFIFSSLSWRLLQDYFSTAVGCLGAELPSKPFCSKVLLFCQDHVINQYLEKQFLTFSNQLWIDWFFSPTPMGECYISKCMKGLGRIMTLPVHAGVWA